MAKRDYEKSLRDEGSAAHKPQDIFLVSFEQSLLAIGGGRTLISFKRKKIIS